MPSIRLDKNNICLYCLHNTSGRVPCPICHCQDPFNYENPEPERVVALQPGTILNKDSSPILIGRCLGTGGFGITYLGLDALGKFVAVKEFLPRSAAGRASDSLRIIAHKEQDEIYQYGLQKFVEEARMLARFPEHSNIVRIVTLFEENNTAYFTMVYRRGMTLEQYIKNKSNQGGISQQELLAIMQEVFNGLKAVHQENIFHRDIKPSNIYIPDKDQNEAKPFLLDFGSARQAMRGNATMSVFLTPGYAPMEQYNSTEKQGAYTDIYACAATMYASMRGQFNRYGLLIPPPESMDICRGEKQIEPLGNVSKQPITEEFSRAIHIGLQCKPRKRPQSVAEFEKILGLFSFTSSQQLINYELQGIAGEYDGITFPLNDGPIWLGRNPKKCNLVIPNHDRSRVSGVHCQIYTENGQVYLEDVSRHGTTVNEYHIKHEKKELALNDILNLQGEAVFQIIQSKEQQFIKFKPEPITSKTMLASFWQRFTAWFIDSMVLTVGIFVMWISELMVLGTFGAVLQPEEGSQLFEIMGNTGSLVLLSTSFVVPWIYYATMESSFKQATIGKMALSIIVTDIQGKRLSFWRASGRYFGKLLSTLILMIGFLMVFFTKNRQALHDIIAQCLVVSKM